MGRFAEARPEYDKGVSMVPDEETKMQYLERSAQTYVRAKDYAGADRAYTALAARARKGHIIAEEVQLLRSMAMYQSNDNKAFEILDQAAAALRAGNVSAAESATALSLILRDRAVRAARTKRPQIVAKTIADLQDLSNRTSRADVLEALNIARGAVLIAEGNKSNAVTILQDEQDNILGLQLLISALPPEDATVARTKLAAIHEVTIEQALMR